MVLTSHSIAHIGKTIDYCLQPSKVSNVLHSDGLDLSGLSLDEFVHDHNTSIVKSEFLLYQNERLKKPYLSLILSPQVDIENEKLKEIVNDTLKEMGLDNHQMIAITHLEMRGLMEARKPVKHVHILVNRVDYDGKTYNDKFIGIKGIQAASKVAKKHNLLDVYNNRQYTKEMAVKSESQYHSKKSEIKYKLISLIEPIINTKTTHSIDDIFQELMNEHHVDIEITQFKNGRFGVMLNFEGESFKASEVSRLLTIVPGEEGYKANKQLQVILNRNIENSLRSIPMTKKEIDDAFLEHRNAELYLSQLAELTAFLSASIHDRHKTEREERDAKYLKNKFGKRPKQIGFKHQI